VSTDEIGRAWVAAVAQSKAESAARRQRVLAHEDLVAQLQAPPLHIKTPEKWSGWVPPRTMPEQTCNFCRAGDRCHDVDHLARTNDSPRRAALVAIATEALSREQQAAA
jgi:hypothetical protein